MIRLVLLALTCAVLIGCSSTSEQKKRPRDGTYEQLSPFETGQDPFA